MSLQDGYLFYLSIKIALALLFSPFWHLVEWISSVGRYSLLQRPKNMTCPRSGKHQPGASVCEIIYCMWNPQYTVIQELVVCWYQCSVPCEFSHPSGWLFLALIPHWGGGRVRWQIKSLAAVYTEIGKGKDKSRLRSGGEQGRRRSLNAEGNRANTISPQREPWNVGKVSSRVRACGQSAGFAERQGGKRRKVSQQCPQDSQNLALQGLCGGLEPRSSLLSSLRGTHVTPQRSPKHEPSWTRARLMWSSALSYWEGELGFLRKLLSHIKRKLDPGGQDIRISFCSAFCNIYSCHQQWIGIKMIPIWFKP